MSDKVCVIGTWHLGTVTSACLADIGPWTISCPKAMGEAGFLYLGSGRGQAATERSVAP